MFRITLSDLLYRRRQFLIATAGAGLVFAMTLLLAGLAAGFGVEIDQTVSGFQADAWVVKANTANRVAALAPLPERTARQVAALPGVNRATPVVDRSAIRAGRRRSPLGQPDRRAAWIAAEPAAPHERRADQRSGSGGRRRPPRRGCRRRGATSAVGRSAWSA